MGKEKEITRFVVSNILTVDEAASLTVGKLPLDHPLVERVISHMTDAAIVPQAYATVEDNLAGHPWHFDTGDTGHMPWCRWSASVLLSPFNSYTGGEFHFRDGPAWHYYLDALIYSSDWEHRVMPHRGERKVLLVFLGAKDGE